MFTKSQTNRGFNLINFSDCYGHKCSIQESSLADQQCVWLGIDDAEPKILASKAHRFGIETTETSGWIPYPIPDEVLLHTRMHLTREQAGDLAKVLTRFSETGELKP
jgi:hypothetical protein